MFKNENQLRITAEFPTTIVKDFEIFLMYLESNTVKLTKTNNYMTRKDLKAVYTLMSEPKLSVGEKGNQPDYPLIHLFFHLATTLDLVQQVHLTNGAFATINADRAIVYKGLTPTEQFVSLFIAFWIHLDWGKIQDGYYKNPPQDIDFLVELLKPFPACKELKMNTYKEVKEQLYQYEHFLYYFSYFGLWDVSIDFEKSHQPGRTKHKVAKSIVLKPFYKWIEDALLETWVPFVSERDMAGFEFLNMITGLSIKVEEEDTLTKDERAELFLSLVKPIFAEDQLGQVLTKKENVFLERTHHFNVKMIGTSSRTLHLEGSQTLMDLNIAIQKAFDLHGDHLYSFYMDGKKFSKNCYNSPMDYTGPFVDEVKIGSLHLYAGKRFLYLYDFGAEWEFYIDVVRAPTPY